MLLLIYLIIVLALVNNSMHVLCIMQNVFTFIVEHIPKYVIKIYVFIISTLHIILFSIHWQYKEEKAIFIFVNFQESSKLLLNVSIFVSILSFY